MIYCFIQNFFFRTTRELEHFFLSREAQILFSPKFNIRLCQKL